MSWNWNPPAAPHFGGVFESMIKSAERAIFAVLGDADPKRPITRISPPEIPDTEL